MITANKHIVSTEEGSFTLLKDSSALLKNVPALQAEIALNGYLFMKGFFDRAWVLSIRANIAEIFAKEGVLDPNFPADELKAKPGVKMTFRPDIANASAKIREFINQPKLLDFYTNLLGSESKAYDYIWMRAVAPGLGTYPHCDIVYMGRGTRNLYTCWIPYGDVPLNHGGLVLLENSHKSAWLQESYGKTDVDTSCSNKLGMNQLESAGFQANGAIDDFPQVQEMLGGRWMSTNYEAGDLVTFGMYMAHGSLDNHTDRIRISTDTRYQSANEPFDPRWIGQSPPGHGADSRQDLIC